MITLRFKSIKNLDCHKIAKYCLAYRKFCPWNHCHVKGQTLFAQTESYSDKSKTQRHLWSSDFNNNHVNKKWKKKRERITSLIPHNRRNWIPWNQIPPKGYFLNLFYRKSLEMWSTIGFATPSNALKTNKKL